MLMSLTRGGFSGMPLKGFLGFVDALRVRARVELSQAWAPVN